MVQTLQAQGLCRTAIGGYAITQLLVSLCRAHVVLSLLRLCRQGEKESWRFQVYRV